MRFNSFPRFNSFNLAFFLTRYICSIYIFGLKGIGKSSFLASVRKDGSMKTLPLEEGSSKGLNIKSKKIVFSRSLRVPQPPPIRPGNPGPRPGHR